MAAATDDRPRYMISVAAELVGMHPQTLRIYESKGLVRPKRTPGGTRLFSELDLERLRVKGRGAPHLKGNGRGDLLARVKVSIPKKLTKAEREALENLQRVSREDPREKVFS